MIITLNTFSIQEQLNSFKSIEIKTLHMYLYGKFTRHSNMEKRGAFASYRKTKGREIGINKLNIGRKRTL